MLLILVLLVSVWQLRAQGRLWTCACGYVLLWSGDIHTADNSQHVFDPYSFTHVLHGFMFLGLVLLLFPRMTAISQLVLVLAIEAVWEVIENTNFIIELYREGTIALGYTGDTIVNSFGDLVACGAGAVIARRVGWKRTVVAFFAIEVMLAVWVRDGLLLNIIMLIYPIEGIRQWQMP